MSRIWLPLGSIVLSYVELLFFKHPEKFSTTFSVIYDFASFWHPKWGAYAVYPKMGYSVCAGVHHHISHQDCSFWICASFSKWTCQPWALKPKKQCFQHVRPPTFRTKFHHSSMAMMTCQLSPCERYHPVRRWWNHFIIYKNHPSTWCLRFPMGSKNIPSIPIQLANSRCDPPHVGTTEPENIMQSASSTENITPSVRGIINNEPWTIVFFASA